MNAICTGVVQEKKVEETKKTTQVEELPGHDAIVASMEGSLWTRPSPDQPAFVKEGDRVEVGQTLGLVEVMKTFTPIHAEKSGVFARWNLNDGDPITVEQTIGWIKT